MKKILPIIVVLSLVLSGLGAVAITDERPKTTHYESTVSFSSPIIKNYDSNYVDVQLEDVSTYYMKPTQPMLPKVVEIIELEFGVKNVQIDVIPQNVEVYDVSTEIRPAPLHVPLTVEEIYTDIENVKDEAVYASSELVPSAWFQYKIGCGLNADMERKTLVALHIFPVRYSPAESKLYVAEKADISISYKEPESSPLPEKGSYDMVIIAPQKFSFALQRLIRHKNSHGIQTLLTTTNEIYRQYSGVDKPEQIKYFIKDMIETYDIKYVLIVGGLRNVVWSRPRDDCNQGTKGWEVPVRYNNLYDDPEHPLAASSIYDPGVITDLYYADIYEDGGNFSSWDPNGDGIFAAMSKPGVENDTGIDMFPDVSLGRLACRNIREVKILVRKIINYEKEPADPSWFKKTIVVSGDGFLDQVDLDFQWDVTSLPDGEYTIYGQSKNPENNYGPIDDINVTLDRTVESNITFNHDDHLQIEGYPSPPITEITSPSEGDILGNTDFFYEPHEGEAYGNMFTWWANVSFENGVMHVRGKSYDPQPYGNVTDVHLWIENSAEEIVFEDWRNGTEMYYEGEWICGEVNLRGKGGALYYMPGDFEKEILWASNGNFTGQDDVIAGLTEGAGFVFLSGHGSPRVWADHYPGIPGNRGHGSVTGLVTIDRFGGPPFFPFSRIRNDDKPFVIVVGGCHNSQFNVSYVTSKLDRFLPLFMWTYGGPAPECFSWWLTRLPGRGAIASIGNTGLGYGTLGGDCTIGGLDGGISLEFFRHYGELGYDILGEAYTQTLTYYASNFDMEEDDHIKSLHQWVLLGDPSLMLGGYS